MKAIARLTLAGALLAGGSLAAGAQDARQFAAVGQHGADHGAHRTAPYPGPGSNYGPGPVPNHAQIAAASIGMTGDPEIGARTFRRSCGACHTTEPGGRHKVGPNLHGVYGHSHASKPDYPYTDAFRAAKVVWDEPTLKRFLANPGQTIPGTKMDYALKSAEDIANVAAYLRDLPQ